MKLRNKKTGEIATLTLSTNGEDMIIMGNDMYAHITKLSELKDYEDYKEPTDHWHITFEGIICDLNPKSLPEHSRNAKLIGNYFETKEEAELAVRKLKAWKRLKDKGFKFNCWYGGSKDISFSIPQEIIDKTTAKDLDLLFGGEE
jgi:hypothetical protein